MRLEKFDVLIVGAGFAGAATAFHLSRVFRGSILIIEREEVPGAHASGRNASLILQSVADSSIRGAVAAGQSEYARLQAEVGFRQVGSLMLGPRDRLEELRDSRCVESFLRGADEICRRVPLLAGHRFTMGLETPGDGVIDIWALLQHYLAGARARGAALRPSCELRSIRGRGPFRIETSRGEFEVEHVVNAAGAWATEVAAMAGAEPLPLAPWKRHLFVLDGVPGIDPEWPFVWGLEPEFYFRPDGPGLLFSLCDEERSPRPEPTVTPGISQRGAEFVLKQFPALHQARERDLWSCFRTKAPDGRFAIGWDPRLERFFWVAGLGGHGVGSSWEVGRLAAAAFCDRELAKGAPADPSRLV
jgi:D-arginine dehydrogenase